MTASVVIRTYTDRRWDGLVAAVESIAEQHLPPGEVVVVVDHNRPLLDRVRARFPRAKVVPSRTRGSAGAWNAGVEEATGEIVAFIDDDAVAHPGWLRELVEPYADPRVQGVGGLIEPDWTGDRPDWFPEEFQWVVGCSYRGLPETPAPVRNLIGCNMSFRRDALRASGGFHETDGLGHLGGVPIGGDETEFCIRLRRTISGSILLHQPSAVVWHTVPRERARFAYFLRRCALEGRSKAVISRLAGASDGLSSEVRYSTRVLPAALARDLRVAARGDPAAARRAGAVLAGFATTAAAYAAARLRLALTARPA